MIIKGSSASNISRVSNLIINLRKINIFNRRGLKITKSILLRKKGKKASS
jgi:ribosomal protein L6P/L9E